MKINEELVGEEDNYDEMALAKDCLLKQGFSEMRIPRFAFFVQGLAKHHIFVQRLAKMRTYSSWVLAKDYIIYRYINIYIYIQLCLSKQRLAKHYVQRLAKGDF